MAQRVMSFAEPNQILVSRSYYEVVSRLAPDYAQLFQYVAPSRQERARARGLRGAPGSAAWPCRGGGLAVHIDDPEVRKVFLAEAERL